MKDSDIQDLLEEAAEHFEVQVPQWEIRPEKWIENERCYAAYQDGLPSKIEFFGRPDRDTVWHEFCHHVLFEVCGKDSECLSS